MFNEIKEKFYIPIMNEIEKIILEACDLGIFETYFYYESYYPKNSSFKTYKISNKISSKVWEDFDKMILEELQNIGYNVSYIDDYPTSKCKNTIGFHIKF